MKEKSIYGEVQTCEREEDYKPISMESAVLELVANGIKAAELVAHVAAKKYEKQTVRFTISTDNCVDYAKPMPVYEDVGSPVDYINNLVNEGKIIELEYVLTHMDYRIKSMYFLPGTKLRVVKRTIEDL